MVVAHILVCLYCMNVSLHEWMQTCSVKVLWIIKMTRKAQSILLVLCWKFASYSNPWFGMLVFRFYLCVSGQNIFVSSMHINHLKLVRDHYCKMECILARPILFHFLFVMLFGVINKLIRKNKQTDMRHFTLIELRLLLSWYVHWARVHHLAYNK